MTHIQSLDSSIVRQVMLICEMGKEWRVGIKGDWCEGIEARPKSEPGHRGLWDQDVMDSPSDAASRGIHYSAVMGEQLWRLISGNTLQVGELKYPFDRNFWLSSSRIWIRSMNLKHWRRNLRSTRPNRQPMWRRRSTLSKSWLGIFEEMWGRSCQCTMDTLGAEGVLLRE